MTDPTPPEVSRTPTARERKARTIQVRCTAEQFARLEDEAHVYGVTVSEVVRRLLDEAAAAT